MKVRNLYIGEIRIISEIDYNYIDDTDTYKTKLSRKSILYKLDRKNKVRDIMYGGTYNIGFPGGNGEAGDEFASELKSGPIINLLQTNGYVRKNITKRKLLKIMATQAGKNK